MLVLDFWLYSFGDLLLLSQTRLWMSHAFQSHEESSHKDLVPRSSARTSTRQQLLDGRAAFGKAGGDAAEENIPFEKEQVGFWA